MQGGVLEKLNEQSQNLCSFLEMNFNVLITEIVLDFITNGKGENILFNIKSMRLKQPKKKV